MNNRTNKFLYLFILISNFIIMILIISAGIILINKNDTNGYFVICIGLQFIILRLNRNIKMEENNE